MTALDTDRPTYGIAEAARRTGLSAHTLRYYERDGLLLAAVARSTSGHRRYCDDDLRWVDLISRLRATGMPIRDVRRYAELVRAGGGNEEARLRMLGEHRRRVLAELAEITGHLDAINTKIDQYTASITARGLTA